jgi:predicted GIY-YIG superfamily endonuclease
MYFTYILESEFSGKIYIGPTNDLVSRIKRHNNNENLYTKK